MLGVLHSPRHVKAAGAPSQGCETSTSVTVISWAALIWGRVFASQAESPQSCGSSQPAMLDEMGSWCVIGSRPGQCRSSRIFIDVYTAILC